MSSERDRFWSKVDRKADDECWPWTAALAGGRDGESYGYFRISQPRRQVYAHRFAYCDSNGVDIRSLDSSTVVRHRCDNTICCNPAHLEPGIQKDDAQDMVVRGRSLRGTRSPAHKLLEHEIHEIRKLLACGTRHKDIAHKYGVSRPAISVINSGKNWAWLPSDAAT